MPQLCSGWSSSPSSRSHLQYQRVRVYFGLNENEACEKLTYNFFLFFFNAGTTVFSISFLKLKTGKLIKETNPFILNMLYNSGLWDQEMKWKSHLCHQACSSPWWVLLFTLYCWGFLTSCGFTFKSSNLTTYTCYVISGYLQGCFLIICRNS